MEKHTDYNCQFVPDEKVEGYSGMKDEGKKALWG